jgi:AraC-like DNA-binding protein
MRYVNRVKLERIRVLMEREHIPLARAAGLYGYADPNYVSRLYRAYFGVTLTEAVELESTVRGR